ncbi:MAG: LysE family transporter [Pseudomonadota bacterium]
MAGLHVLPAFVLAAVFGMVAANKALTTMSCLGILALLAQWPTLVDVVQVCGGLYLAYLGLEMLNTPAPETAREHKVAAWGLLMGSVFILNL